MTLQGVVMASSSVTTVAVFEPRTSVTATTIVEIGLTNETVVSYVLYVPAYNRQTKTLKYHHLIKIRYVELGVCPMQRFRLKQYLHY